jgi:hypothetical protein
MRLSVNFFLLENILGLYSTLFRFHITVIGDDNTGPFKRAVRKVASHFEYLENRSRGLDITW